MKTLPVLALLSTVAFTLQAQWVWSPAQLLAHTGGDAMHPSFVNGDAMFWFTTDEWLAFGRRDSTTGGSDICVLRSAAAAASWASEPEVVTTDSGLNDWPSVARRISESQDQELMLVFEHGGDAGRTYTYWSHRADSLWSEAQPVDRGGGDDYTPFVTPSDSTFGMVWIRDGAVMFSEFRGGVWATAVRVSPPGDSDCTTPRIQGIRLQSQPLRWFVSWESRKPGDLDRALYYALGSDTGWTEADSLAWAGDNRHPHPYRTSWPGMVDVSWESDRSGDWEIYASSGSVYGGAWSWNQEGWNISMNPGVDDRHAALELFPVITAGGDVMTYFTASAWVITAGASDSIRLSSWGGSDWTHRSAGPGAVDRRPDISGGILVPMGVRVWVVWESDMTGVWRLYGSSIDIPLHAADDGSTLPLSARLTNSYPNPFNGSTTIEAWIPERMHVRLSVFDLLGREVALLADGERERGRFTISWDAADASSGVYLCRLQARGHSLVRKIMLLR